MADFYVHTGMIGLDGTKMSKSLGNLVFVHELTKQGYAPSAIRLGVFSGHYRSERDWSDEVLEEASARLRRWTAAVAERPGSLPRAQRLVSDVRAALADDLDTPTVLQRVDEWAQEDLEAHGADDPEAGDVVATALHSLLGVRAR